jgi:hypothetical protein
MKEKLTTTLESEVKRKLWILCADYKTRNYNDVLEKLINEKWRELHEMEQGQYSI